MLQKWLLRVQIYLLRKPKFRKWTKLEDKKYEFIQSVEDSQPNLPETLFDYLSTALYFPVKYEKLYWKDAIESFYKIHGVTSTIRKIPITSNPSKLKSDKDVWDYPGRLWSLYLNIIAYAYHWTEKQIANLKVDDALAFIQEILTDKQLEKEFIWSTSEIAYPYDTATKQSKFQPLERPYWMVKTKSIRKAPPIPKSLLPVGNVVRLDEAKKTKSE
jgi:hypothetical protein